MRLLKKFKPLMDRLESKMDTLEEILDGVEDEITNDVHQIDPDKAFLTWHIITFSLGNLFFVAGSALFWSFFLKGSYVGFVVFFICGIFLLTGIGLLFSEHQSQKLTGMIMTLTNILVFTWILGLS